MEGRGGWGGGALKPNEYARLSNEVKYYKNNHLHTVEHVVQSTFRNLLRCVDACCFVFYLF